MLSQTTETESSHDIYVLPGLDGAAVLRENFAAQMTDLTGRKAKAVQFPPDRYCTYAELTEHVRTILPVRGRYVLVGESFSGPIALRVALERPSQVRALILVGTYVTNPMPFPLSLLRPFIRPFLFKLPPPPGLIRKFIVASTAADDLMPLFQDVVRKMVKPHVLACRVRSAMAIDARQDLRECKVPMLHLSATHERILPGHADEEIRTLRPDIKEHRMDCGHCILECYPEMAAPLVADFLNGLSL